MIVLEGDSVSRRHAHFEQRSGAWWCVDDGSTNGSYVNDDQIMREARLGNGDRIKIGPTIFKFLSGQDVEAQYHEEIYRMTIIDGLTQVHVKRYLLESLDKEMIRARRHTRDLSFLMLDIDHFKQINDVHGHLAGDYVLKEVARLIQQRIRRDEVLARYGGEEFAIILPETNMEGARALAEGLREKIEQSRFIFQGEVIRVTISIGIAMLEGDRASPRSDSAGRRQPLQSEARRPQPRPRVAMGQSLPDVRVAPPGPRSREMATRLAEVESPSVDARRRTRALASGEDQAAIALRRRVRLERRRRGRQSLRRLDRRLRRARPWPSARERRGGGAAPREPPLARARRCLCLGREARPLRTTREPLPGARSARDARIDRCGRRHRGAQDRHPLHWTRGRGRVRRRLPRAFPWSSGGVWPPSELSRTVRQ